MGILHDRADVTTTELLKQRLELVFHRCERMVNPETGMLENDEARMTKKVRLTKSEERLARILFGLRHSFVLRRSDFVIPSHHLSV